jgi:hypothetical protein
MSADSGRHQDGFEVFEATHEEARAYSHGWRDGYDAAEKDATAEPTATP